MGVFMELQSITPAHYTSRWTHPTLETITSDNARQSHRSGAAMYTFGNLPKSSGLTAKLACCQHSSLLLEPHGDKQWVKWKPFKVLGLSGPPKLVVLATVSKLISVSGAGPSSQFREEKQNKKQAGKKCLFSSSAGEGGQDTQIAILTVSLGWAAKRAWSPKTCTFGANGSQLCFSRKGTPARRKVIRNQPQSIPYRGTGQNSSLRRQAWVALAQQTPKGYDHGFKEWCLSPHFCR